MPSKYWIKLYHEVLHDPKMGRLSDRLWRRFVELCLLAGENDGEGILPTLEDMAWTLRLDETELQADIDELERLGFVRLVDEHICYEVTNFSKRQAPIPTAERVARYRDRQRQEQYYGNEDDNEPCNESLQDDETNHVTNRLTDTDTDTDTEVETETETEAEAETHARDGPAAAVSAEDDDLLALLATVPHLDMGVVRRKLPNWNPADVPGWVAAAKLAGPELAPRVLVARLDARDPPPFAMDEPNPRRFIEGEYADFIQH